MALRVRFSVIAIGFMLVGLVAIGGGIWLLSLYSAVPFLGWTLMFMGLFLMLVPVLRPRRYRDED